MELIEQNDFSLTCLPLKNTSKKYLHVRKSNFYHDKAYRC